MFGLADLKKINERAARKRGQRFSTDGYMIYIRRPGAAKKEYYGLSGTYAREITDALNLADAVAEANANAVGRT